MNYSRHYNTLIDRARTRTILPGIYFEKHHIIPKCLGGNNEPDNIVNLFPEEHYIAHLLLVKIHPTEKKLVYAARLMCRDSKNTKRNNKEYAWLKERFINLKKGIPRTDEEKEKIRNGNIGKQRSEITKERIKIARSKQLITEESNRKRSNTAKEKGIRPPSWIGKTHTEDTKRKISESKKGIESHWKGKHRPKIECPHCGKIGAGGAMNRYHFENCKKLDMTGQEV